MPHISAEIEIWKPVAECEGFEVSSCGRVRSIDRHVLCGGGPKQRAHVRHYKGKLLRLSRASHGYQNISLPNGKYLVHRLVLSAFVGPCPKGCEGLHDDDKRTNNRLSNLRWGTRAENIEDAFRNGGRKRKGLNL